MLKSVLFVGLAVSAYAGEVLVSDMKLRNTYVKTTDASLSISVSPVDAISPTTVNCPRRSRCALSIELAAQFNGLGPPDPNVVAVIVTVDGSTANILPNAVLGLDSTSTGGGSNARSFVWMTKPLEARPHTVQIQVYVAAANGHAGSADRTLKINVYEVGRSGDRKR